MPKSAELEPCLAGAALRLHSTRWTLPQTKMSPPHEEGGPSFCGLFYRPAQVVELKPQRGHGGLTGIKILLNLFD